MILDMDFNQRFNQLIESSAAVGGNVELAQQLRDGCRDCFPAKSTAEELLQYEAKYKGLAKMLIGEQSGALVKMKVMDRSRSHLLPARSGTGKSLLIVKYACDYLIRWQVSWERDSGKRSV